MTDENMTDCSDFIGRSKVMQTVFHQIDRAARSDAAVFITGETGTGKELCAHAIHTQSTRSTRPFIALNCAALPADLLESEVFGHNRGAFTGAVSRRDGAAVLADGGTLFLDEIGELPPMLQAKLLRFLQTGQVQRIGSNEIIKTNIRIICATNRDPWPDVESGRMRKDLYYRLHVIPVTMPPLRRRGDDIMRLAEYFLSRFNKTEQKNFVGFCPQAQEKLHQYHWPGNVRELENIIRYAIIMHEGSLIRKKMITFPHSAKFSFKSMENVVAFQTPGQDPDSLQKIKPLAEMERQLIQTAINHCDGNISRAAAHLAVSPSTLYRKIQAWENTNKN